MNRTWHPVSSVVAAAGACVLGGAPAVQAVAPTTVRVSVSSTGVQSRTLVTVAPAGVSDTGRYVLESSKTSRLVAGDTNGRIDVFLRDTQAGTTVRVSVSSAGRQGNGASVGDALSPDARYVLFSSGASDLAVAADTNHATDVFVRDRALGITRRVSIAPAGGQFAGPSNGDAISADGRFVLFNTNPPGHTPRAYLRDRLLGVTTRVGRVWDRWIVQGRALSGDGRMVAYTRSPQKQEISDLLFIHDRQTGQTTEVNGQPGWTFDPTVWGVRFSADGQKALITGQSTTGAGEGAVSVWTVGGPVTQVTDGTRWALGVGVSDDGTRVAFESEDPHLVSGDTNHARDVFVRDLTTGTTTRVDLSASGAQIAQGVEFDHWLPVVAVAALSGDGRFVAFDSDDPDVVPGDTNATVDVFLSGPLS
jgi:hypothetical protein